MRVREEEVDVERRKQSLVVQFDCLLGRKYQRSYP